MKVRLQIQVIQMDNIQLGKHKVLFERILDLDDSLSLPYDSLYRSLKFLYPHPNVSVVFRVS